MLTIHNQHTAAGGTPPVYGNESADLYLGYSRSRPSPNVRAW